ncbi:MAG: dTDP-4-dehydrorhamnose reductase [Candidatus Heimdallarchaeota archaeon]|nr:dTDP-4-dehydrorhamnose reductase [Candidatus Heimdallarchaeota archaeon]
MRNRTILIIGNRGQLGSALVKELSNFQVMAIGRPDLDMLRNTSISRAIDFYNPGLVINAAAYTDVDGAEVDNKNALQVNARAVKHLGKLSNNKKFGLIHYSTDYVFDGTKKSPYIETDKTNPINFYGKSKLLGEQYLQKIGGSSVIFRTSWVYSLTHQCFATKVLQWANSGKKLSIVDDQISSPTWANLLAGYTAKIIEKSKNEWFEFFQEYHGLYHFAGRGKSSRFEWAEKILKINRDLLGGPDIIIDPGKSSDFPSPAIRPEYSVLDSSKFETTFGYSIPSWEESLEMAFKEKRTMS